MNQQIKNQAEQCKVCGEVSASVGLYYGAVTCQACKKFFYRSRDNGCSKYVCRAQLQCPITVDTRQNCRFCRYHKCLDQGMDLTIHSSELSTKDLLSQCAVCCQASSGVHFGVLTCEGCKGFFRRSRINDKSSLYECKREPLAGKPCPLSSFNCCRFCRYQKCLQVGMCYESRKTGRQSNLRKRQILMARKPMKNLIQPHSIECGKSATALVQSNCQNMSEGVLICNQWPLNENELPQFEHQNLLQINQPFQFINFNESVFGQLAFGSYGRSF